MPYRVKRHAVTQPLDKPYRFIPLTQEKIAIVDAADFEWLSNWNWRVQWNKRGRCFYVVRSEYIGDQRTANVYMHRQILGCVGKEQADHRNRNALDNRRENLRRCDNSQNNMNRSKSPRNTTGFRGVTCEKNGKFSAYIQKENKHYNLGRFGSAKEAAQAYDAAAKKFHGEFANLNFQDSPGIPPAAPPSSPSGSS